MIMIGDGSDSQETHVLRLAAQVCVLVLDVDGVLTDGRIMYSDDGHEYKAFNVQDGASTKLLQRSGIDIAIITGRKSPIVAKRARELGINWVVQGASSKTAALEGLISKGLANEGIACIGDDIQDLELFDHPATTLSLTVANAHPAVLQRAHAHTDRRGGEGVVVEVAEFLLKSQDKWPY